MQRRNATPANRENSLEPCCTAWFPQSMARNRSSARRNYRPKPPVVRLFRSCRRSDPHVPLFPGAEAPVPIGVNRRGNRLPERDSAARPMPPKRHVPDSPARPKPHQRHVTEVTCVHRAETRCCETEMQTQLAAAAGRNPHLAAAALRTGRSRYLRLRPERPKPSEETPSTG